MRSQSSQQIHPQPFRFHPHQHQKSIVQPLMLTKIFTWFGVSCPSRQYLILIPNESQRTSIVFPINEIYLAYLWTFDII
jgi:hypothetical protein